LIGQAGRQSGLLGRQVAVGLDGKIEAKSRDFVSVCLHIVF